MHFPVFRFQLGAYGANCIFQWMQGVLYTDVYSDPNVKETVDALRAMPEAIREMEQLTQEELDAYILSAYAYSNAPQGLLDELINAMTCDILGMDAERTLAVRADARNATAAQQAEAAEHIAGVLENAAFCMVGNENLIRADADCFDEVVSWRSGE